MEPESSLLETKMIAGFISYKICRLSFVHSARIMHVRVMVHGDAYHTPKCTNVGTLHAYQASIILCTMSTTMYEYSTHLAVGTGPLYKFTQNAYETNSLLIYCMKLTLELVKYFKDLY